jgi:hypothetical protein
MIEVHPPLQEDAGQTPTLTDLTRLIVDATRAKPLRHRLDWRRAHPGAKPRDPDAVRCRPRTPSLAPSP